MADTKSKPTVFSVVKEIVTILENTIETSAGKAALAKLRHSTGQPLSRMVDVLPMIFEKMPEEFLGFRGEVTKEERAILITIQLYAWHQQGAHDRVNTNEKYKNMGAALRSMRRGEATVVVDRRFNALITSQDFEELIYHLRQMIRLLKSRTKEKINYPQLSEDLYWFLRGQKEKLRISWAQEYYKQKGDDTDENE
ncbi:CRISPR system CASCADE complex protein CasB [Megasphaera lornae]|uniref:CRISPR system CASCADE complex protein CasB n=2 Tax=Megasphaera TaxID=906 RepID=D3LV77_9FIRM|nr:type I-E CRISPR-associated protein Cse2/CasB [Megasphaera genomosp. type_1]EFD93804.1 CRISPR system CASCADE complex protein CasB [Megasphaera genomosp. type_1 str. 28L]